jgi:hypothetical protein
MQNGTCEGHLEPKYRADGAMAIMSAGIRKKEPRLFLTVVLFSLSAEAQNYAREGEPPQLAACSLFAYRHLQSARSGVYPSNPNHFTWTAQKTIHSMLSLCSLFHQRHLRGCSVVNNCVTPFLPHSRASKTCQVQPTFFWCSFKSKA